MSPPVHMYAAWPRVRRELTRAGRFALFSDFDGTLTAIRPRPEMVRCSPRVRDLLERIAAHGHLVGIISGRALEDVRRCVGVRGIWYAGTHGHYLCSPRGERIVQVSAKVQDRVRFAEREVRRRLERVKAVRIENKGAAVAVHVRGASKSDIAQAERAVQAAARGLPQLEILRGKKILELVPSGGADKWHAVRTILHREKAQGIPVFYLGDDTTDETVFRTLGGFSVAVGKRRQTAAKFFLRSPAEVRKFLALMSKVQ